MFAGRVVALACGMALSANGLRFREPQAKSTPAVTQADVDALRAKLVAVESGFEGMDAKARPDVAPFVEELEWAMSETDYVSSADLPAAYARLEAVSGQVPTYMALMLGAPAPVTTTPRPAETTTTQVVIPRPKVPVEAPSPEDLKALRSQLASATEALAPVDADVELLRAKLESFERGLDGVLRSKLGALSNAQVEPELKTFDEELRKVLTKSRSMSPADAMKRLGIAEADAMRMTAKLTARQEVLVKEAEEHEESLLLGELMTLQKAPMSEQRAVCEHGSFAALPICKALLAAQNDAEPFYKQGEDFLNGVVTKDTLDTVVGNATRTANAYFSRLDHASLKKATTSAMEQRLAAMDAEFAARAKVHGRRSEQLGDALKRSATSAQDVMQGMVTRESDGYTAWTHAQSSDIATLRSALAALKHADVEAAVRSMRKLKTPMNDLMDQLKVLASTKQKEDGKQN